MNAKEQYQAAVRARSKAHDEYMKTYSVWAQTIRDVEEAEKRVARESAPAGFTVAVATSDYFGSHDESHGSEEVVFAYPGEDEPVVDFTHGTYHKNWRSEIAKFGGVFWDGDMWVTADQMDVD